MNQFDTLQTYDPGNAKLYRVPDAAHNAFLEQPSVVLPAIVGVLTAAELVTTH